MNKTYEEMTDREKQQAKFERDRVLAGNFGKHETRLMRIKLQEKYRNQKAKT